MSEKDTGDRTEKLVDLMMRGRGQDCAVYNTYGYKIWHDLPSPFASHL
jgi:hypothetical protein